MSLLPPAIPSNLTTLRQWAEEHAAHGSQPWALVCDLFKELDKAKDEATRLRRQLAAPHKTPEGEP